MIHNIERWMITIVIAALIVISSVGIISACDRNFPPGIEIQPYHLTEEGIPSIFFGTPTVFTYYSCQNATAVDIRIHVDDGGSDIIGNMTGGPSKWTFNITFFPRHGEATVTYIVNNCSNSNKSTVIYIDPAGYIYDIDTGARIANASVWLQRPNGIGEWENVKTGENPPACQPDINPLTSDQNGMYHWDVLNGYYRVHVEAPGYEPSNSSVVYIPPPVYDLNVGLNHIDDPNVTPVYPVANFSTNVNTGYAPLVVQFTDFSTNATDRKWDFGDGFNSTKRYPDHNYSVAGNYTVNLTAINGNGINSTTSIITVRTKT